MIPSLNFAKGFFKRHDIIKKQVRKDKNTVYGARAIQRQIGIFSRQTDDWDIYSRTPRKSADKLQKSLDKESRGDFFYSTPSKHHKGTHKVYFAGYDMKKNTPDDVGIADFSRPERKIRTIKVEGIKYAHVSESIKDKRKSLKSKEFEFRHKKDREDLNRIQLSRRIGRV